ncbi:hypothetical protein GGE65_006611 [Skermanella aerolata]|uniref:hypothetical protein n=1 Tax=Skermanella aerolata TaxID=393310 RepID=UPI003D1B7D1E
MTRSTGKATNSVRKKPPTEVKVGAVGIGCGGGTLVNMLIDHFMIDPSWKTMFSYLSPAITLGITWLWAFISSWFSEFKLRRRMAKLLTIAEQTHERNVASGSSEEVLSMGRQTIDALKKREFEIIGEQIYL